MNHCTAYARCGPSLGRGVPRGTSAGSPSGTAASGGVLLDQLDVGRQHVVVDLGRQPSEVDPGQDVEVALGGSVGPKRPRSWLG